jgi:hypothetical protein
MLDCDDTKFGGGVLIGAAGENVGDLIVGGKKPLHLPWRLEALHDSLSSSGRLVRILRTALSLMPAWTEVTVDESVGGEEVLGLPRGSEPLHLTLSSPGLIDGLWQPSHEPDRQVRFFQADFAVELLILREATMFLVAEAAFRAVEMPIICHC